MHPHYGAHVTAHTIDTIADQLLTGCATVDRHGLPYAGSGILVALDQQHGEVLEPWSPRLTLTTQQQRDELDRACVRQWVARVARVVTSRPAGLYFGAWRDEDGMLYLDVAQAFSDAEEAEALAAARARGQLAVWHAGRRQCVRVSADAVTREAA